VVQIQSPPACSGELGTENNGGARDLDKQGDWHSLERHLSRELPVDFALAVVFMHRVVLHGQFFYSLVVSLIGFNSQALYHIVPLPP